MLDHRLLRWRLRLVKCHTQYLVEVVEVQCPVSLSSHGTVVGPSSEAAVGETAAKAGVLEEVHSLSLKKTDRDSVEVLKAVHTLVLRNYIQVVVLEGSDTFLSVEHDAAVVVGRCSIDC
jgi:hypothetical protein